MEWKAAKVIPLFKSGSMVELEHYRPISILPVLSKILERIVYKQLLSHLENNGLLSSFQFGFRSKRSTELAVTYFTDIIGKEVDNRKILGAAFIDLSKAFDTVSHSCLLNKLPSNGINNKELHWFTDYLFSRTQSAQFKGVLSNANPIFSGVPQGSILEPLLFMIHFNDVHTPLKTTSIITYADDIVIFTAAKDLQSIQKHLSEDCHNLSSWFRDNELVLNLKKGKTECMIFVTAKRLNALNGGQLALSINRTLINTTSSYKYLGVNLDSSLNFESHFDKMYKRAAGRLNLLRTIQPLVDKSSAEKIYKAMIQPVLTYCHGTLDLCGSRSRKSRIESIERRSRKVIGGNYQVQTVESLIKRQSCQLVFDCLQDNVCTPFKGYFTQIEHNINTRNNGCSLNLPKAKLEFGRRSFTFQGALACNTLPRHLRNLNSRFLFKSNLKEFFQ